MLTTGNQLRAGRALAGMDQGKLAQGAGVSTNTISAMERRGDKLLSSSYETIRAVMNVLEAAGIEFLNHGQPGVRLVKRDAVRPDAVGDGKTIRAVVARLEPDQKPATIRAVVAISKPENPQPTKVFVKRGK